VELELEQVQVKDGHIVPTYAPDVTDLEESLPTVNLRVDNGGEKCAEFYRNNGLTSRKKILLDRIRDGDYNALAAISG
jgi:hypothetical protein